MEVVLFLAILAATLAFVGWPLFEPALAGAGPSDRDLRRDDLVEEKDRILGALRDLEHDHGTGKIDDADHAALTAKLKADAARVLKEIDVNDGRRTMRPGEPPPPERLREIEALFVKHREAVGKVDPELLRRMDREMSERSNDPAWIDAMFRDFTAAIERIQTEARFCTKCGTAARSSDAFCGRCGNKIA